ncbi:hypothetical protein R008_M10786 [Saccharomyces cerevisiae R008]|uniref:EC1118_1M3_1178p n=1 Tax=Saccharomyces cerevisiae (strain Lalvin EC1118 / Prise de mousse) TaxID=643680 RepID=C8ZEH2_YEAS8|nr:hypothetical protein R008_M10786 [Saccharomyces cerevisiae R008]KZV08811.1 hypothetical protein WN66_04781 [Saccharomyces cerevisiae]CAY81788.1 EC1118_1M3_1178p [Saccharomyces cerevisiae EC1118]
MIKRETRLRAKILGTNANASSHNGECGNASSEITTVWIIEHMKNNLVTKWLNRVLHTSLKMVWYVYRGFNNSLGVCIICLPCNVLSSSQSHLLIAKESALPVSDSRCYYIL